jgi:hypothetical protein
MISINRVNQRISSVEERETHDLEALVRFPYPLIKIKTLKEPTAMTYLNMTRYIRTLQRSHRLAK